MSVENSSQLRFLLLGAGFTTGYLARNVQHQDFQAVGDVVFLSRTPEKLAADGLQSYDPLDLNIDAIIDSIPARPVGEALPYRPIIESLLKQRDIPFIHISSTSVFPAGNQSESLSDLPVYNESSPPEPGSEGGERRLALESEVKAAYGQAVYIVRAGGIYGPGRCLADRFLQGDFSRAAIGNRVVSRIHVHDLARLCVAVAGVARAEPHHVPRLVHAVDGHSVGQREVFNWLEARYDLKIPGDWRSQPYVGRHIRSRFLDQLLPTGLQYPDYRSGFADCLE